MKLKQFLLLTAVPLLLGVGAVTLQATTTRAQAEVQGNPQLAQAEPGDDQGCRERRRPDLGATAQQLGITEAALRDALGLPEEPIALDENGRPTEPPPRPDLAAAAQQLGITETELRTAMGLPEAGLGRGRHRPDFAAAAQELGVTEDALKAALGVPPLDENGRPTERPQRPDFAAAAQELGVTEDALKTALGVPERP